MPPRGAPRAFSIVVMRRAASLITVALLLVFASVALAKTTKKLTAREKDGLSFSKSSITVKHGKVTLKLTNPSGNHLSHSIGIHGHGVSKEVDPGGSAKVTAKLAKGTYTFYCATKGHEKDGMKGTLKVT
jgi:uncharacterized cupredoxin-like copper-binding protein